MSTRAVLVTGASSGIGRKLTEHLAAAGHFVYAGIRKDTDQQELGAIRNVQALRLDVTDPEDIARALRSIADAGRGLYAVVNNAGVVTLGPVVNGDDAEFDLMMRVNVYGPYLVTKAAAPWIAAARGRIVMISSVAGILARGNVSAYSMSKHAIEAFTDCLAEEMAPAGVHVSVVEPGTFRSEIGANAVKRRGPNPLLPDFYTFKEPDDVVAAIELALFEHTPQRRYLAVPNETEARMTIEKQIAQLVQLNEGHAYTYDRDMLVSMLDTALSGARLRRGSMSRAQQSAPRAGDGCAS